MPIIEITIYNKLSIPCYSSQLERKLTLEKSKSVDRFSIEAIDLKISSTLLTPTTRSRPSLSIALTIESTTLGVYSFHDPPSWKHFKKKKWKRLTSIGNPPPRIDPPRAPITSRAPPISLYSIYTTAEVRSNEQVKFYSPTGRAREWTFLFVLHTKKCRLGTCFETGTYFHEIQVETDAVVL